jgi:hypothetical protein
MKKRRMKYTTFVFFKFFVLFIYKERERERETRGGETVLLVSCQCEGIGNGSAAEAEDMSEKVVKEGSANADLKADVQNDQQADCGKRGFRVDGWFVVGVFLSILLGIFFTAAVCYLWLLFLWYLYSLA